MTLWGGRFAQDADELIRRLGDSIAFDRRLYAVDIQGSIAYAGALLRAGVIDADEYARLVEGLERVLGEFERGEFQIVPSDEDIHTAVERRLGELVGSVAGKLHTGRSRNDQVCTDLRLYLAKELDVIDGFLAELQGVLVELAEAHLGVLMPGYTHLQPAQPILFSHWLMVFFWKFQRDRDRLVDVRRRTLVCPLGAGALAGNPFPIDREWLAAELGFESVSPNSIDAVEDRDFVAEALAWAALLQVHLSNLAETLILWSNPAFGFVTLADAYATGSSLMPQKKNPDPLELMRGKAGRLIGHLSGFLSVLKGLPTGYNKDLQEDKEPLFDALDTLRLELPIVAGLLRTMEVHPERMEAALDDAMLATDLADYLVRKGVPFRQSHHLVGQAVREAEKRGCALRDLPLEVYRAIHPAFGDDLFQVFDMRRSVEARQVEGGTATEAVSWQITRARELLAAREVG